MILPENACRSAAQSEFFNFENLNYFLLLTLHILLIWYLPFFPTQDGPSHLYNLLILQDLLNGGKTWGNAFTAQLHAVPNLGFNLIAYPLLKFLHPLIAEKLFVTLYVVLMGLSVPVLLRTFNKPPLPLSFFVYPVIFNFTLLVGFYSYVIAVPLFILAFSLAWRIRNSSLIVKFIVYNLSGIIIFYFHLIPFAFYLLALISIVLSENIDHKQKAIKLIKLSLMISPLLLTFALYQSHGSGSHPDLSYLLSLSRLFNLLAELFIFSSISISKLQLLPAALFMSIFLLLTYFTFKSHYSMKSQKNCCSVEERTLFTLIAMLTFIYLFAPFSFGDGCLFNQRFPWVILLVSLPVLRLPESHLSGRFLSMTLVCMVALFLCVNAVALKRESSKIERFVSGLDVELAKGSFLMSYKTETPVLYPVWRRVDVLMHAASYYGIFKGMVDIGNYETGYYYFPIHFKDTLPPFPTPDQVAWFASTIKFSEYSGIEYILGWDMANADRKKISVLYHLIGEKEQLSIWQRKS